MTLALVGVALAAAASGGDAEPAGAPKPAAQASDRLGPPATDARFFVIGSTACRVCHRELYGRWETTRHFGSADSLSFEQQGDPSCQPCHIPLPDFPEEGVGCESCHGPGSAYAPLAVMIDPFKSGAAGLQDANQTCAWCHNPSHPFHVERDLEAAKRRVH